MNSKRCALVATVCAVVGTSAVAEPAFFVDMVEVDNTFRIPQGSGFDPALWYTYELSGVAFDCAMTLVDYYYSSLTMYHSPGGNTSPLPLPVSGYDANPMSRYDSFLRHPMTDPSDTLLSGGGFVWDNQDLEVGLYPPNFTNPPFASGVLPIGRFTVRRNEGFSRFALANGIEYHCAGNAVTRQANTFLSAPLGVYFDIREINDQYDASMDLEAEFLYLDKEGENNLIDVFFPASRITGVEVLSPVSGWTAEKVFHEGRFGVRLVSDHLPVDGVPESVVLRATLADAGITRDVRFPIESGLDGNPFHLLTKGYWAPVADGLLAGDTNDDGIVDFTDLNNVLTDFGAPGEGAEWFTDLDGSGTVDFGDLNAVLSNFGQQG